MSGTLSFPFSRSPVLPFYLLVSLVSAASGQVSPGERVRVKHACEGDARPAPCRTAIGKVTAVLGDTLVLDDGTGERRLLLGPASQVQRSTGRHGHALLGFGVGILAGAAIGAFMVHDCQRSNDSDMGGLCVLQYFVTIPAGALTGLIVGAVSKRETWKTLKQPKARLELLPTVSPNGVGVAGSLRF